MKKVWSSGFSRIGPGGSQSPAETGTPCSFPRRRYAPSSLASCNLYALHLAVLGAVQSGIFTSEIIGAPASRQNTGGHAASERMDLDAGGKTDSRQRSAAEYGDEQ